MISVVNFFIVHKNPAKIKRNFMYLLQKIHDFENCEQIQALFSDLPQKPYCTNAKGYCYIKPKKQAIKYAYIQPNHPAVAQWLVFDIDNSDALFAFFDQDAPRPQLIIKNPRNGHAHYCYKLTEKMGLWGKSSVKAIKYLKAVYNALQRKLGADSGYSGNLIKNPAHSNWITYTTGAQKSYTLDELAKWLDLTEPTKPQVANDETWYLGRNHEIFERTRHQAYRIAKRYSYDELYKKVFSIASNENERFHYPLDPKELHHIAKSITKFCKSPKFGVYSAEFLEKQRRGAVIANAKGANSKGGKARSAKYDAKRQQAQELRAQGLSIRKIAEQLKVSKTSVEKWVKKVSHLPPNQIIARRDELKRSDEIESKTQSNIETFATGVFVPLRFYAQVLATDCGEACTPRNKKI